MIWNFQISETQIHLLGRDLHQPLDSCQIEGVQAFLSSKPLHKTKFLKVGPPVIERSQLINNIAVQMEGHLFEESNEAFRE